MHVSTVSGGHSMSLSAAPITGLVAGNVTSMMVAPDWWNENTVTRSPTATASSTIAVIMRGVDTATSTPHCASYIHSLRGLLTRATVRGTPNSVLARNDVTRLTLSSPVAATTTSMVSVLTRARDDISHESSSTHWALSTSLTRMASRAWSIITTS